MEAEGGEALEKTGEGIRILQGVLREQSDTMEKFLAILEGTQDDDATYQSEEGREIVVSG